MTREEAAEVIEEATEAYRSSDFPRAGELFSSLLIEPEALEASEEIQWNYALCLANMGQWELAIEHVQAAGYDEELFRESCAESGLTDPRYAFEQAQALYVAQEWEAAVEAFIEVAEHPDLDSSALPELYWNIAIGYAKLEEFDKTFHYLEMSGFTEEEFRSMARQSGVDFSEHDFERASELYSNGSYSEAADAFTAMLLDPGVTNDISEEIHWNIAMCQARLDNWDAAFGHVESSGGDEEEFRRRLGEAGLQPPDDR